MPSAPSRAALLTGRMGSQFGFESNLPHKLASKPGSTSDSRACPSADLNAELRNQLAVQWESGSQFFALGQFKVREVKAGGDGATA